MTLLKNPLTIFIVAFVLAIIPLFLDNENILVMLRLLSFAMFFYAIHLTFKKKKAIKK